jgi:preprotein translocase subunit SecF
MGFYESKKAYKYAMVITAALLIFSVGILANSYIQTGEWFSRSIELKGGTIVTIKTDSAVNINQMISELSRDFGEVSITVFSGFGGSGFQVTTGSNVNTTAVLEKISLMGIGVNDYSTAVMGPALSESFWFQAQVAILMAFVVMAMVVFIVFRSVAPSSMVIICAICDIIETIAFMQIFGIELSLAGLAAILMLIGYSVDTDILLTNRLLRNHGDMVEKTKGAIKTGLTMSATTIGAVVALLISGLSPVLSQIAAILLIGLFMDVANTWIQNYGLLRWYIEKKGIN